ncbi:MULTISPECIES: hypothetical protein [Paenibacillus]|uniref:Uncharacterized protein n=1 Tax=Paenibacillus odorifer TaxID=189426 RepID=A0ABX3GQG6_9BACL|nr:hypothetical protein [Paenibacillus odorifer]OMD34800.1 hypothetical protein BSO21_10285 [Paenibacillus odorifer]
MAKFIRLNSPDGIPLSVNVDHIVAYADIPYQKSTKVYTANDSFIVKQSVEEIDALTIEV